MKRSTIYIFIGPPGAGKGSLSQLCVRNLGWGQLSTGALCRKHIAEKTDLGRRIDFLISSGKLIDDSLMASMVRDWLIKNSENKSGIILDGFPRTVTQAQFLQEMLKQSLPDCNLEIFKLSISEDMVVSRLLHRYVCVNKDCQAVYSLHAQSALAPKNSMKLCDMCEGELVRRQDDNAETIRHRLKTYNEFEQPLLDFYVNNQAKVTTINVEKPLKMVFEEFTQLIAEKQ